MVEIDDRSAKLEQQTNLVEAARASMQDILSNDFDLSRVQQTLQSHHFNIRMLNTELDHLQKKVSGLLRYDITC